MGVKLENNAASTLAAGINSTATSLTVATGHGTRFPAASVASGDYFYCTLVDSSGNIEIIKVTEHTAGADAFSTIVRGQDGTSGTAFASGDAVELRLNKQALVDFQDGYLDQETDQDIDSHKEFQDDKEVRFGDDNDYCIVTDGTDLHIKSGAGESIIKMTADGGVEIYYDDEAVIKTVSGKGAEIYHNGTKVMETHANGVKLSQANDYIDLGNAGLLRLDTPSSTNNGCGITAQFTAGESRTGHYFWYMDTDGKLKLSDADSVNSMPIVAYNQEDVTEDAEHPFLIYGVINNNFNFASAGLPVYAYTSTGYCTTTLPGGSGDQVQRIGISLGANSLLFCPSLDVLEID